LKYNELYKKKNSNIEEKKEYENMRFYFKILQLHPLDLLKIYVQM